MNPTEIKKILLQHGDEIEKLKTEIKELKETQQSMVNLISMLSKNIEAVRQGKIAAASSVTSTGN